MPQTSNRFYDQMARLWSDAASVAHGVRREAGSLFRTQADRFIADMDLVRREDFEAVRELAANARAENETLRVRLEELEARLASVTAVAPAAPTAPVPVAPAKPRRVAKAKPAADSGPAGESPGGEP